MILYNELENHWASQTATVDYQSDIVITRNPRNESNREYNTSSREIVSFNNGGAHNALNSISSADSKLFGESHVGRRNPLSIANRILPAFCSVLPFLDSTKYSHSRGMGSISREKQNLRVLEMDLVAAAPFAEFPRANVFENRSLFQMVPFSNYLCHAFCAKDYAINL